jgi:hypothetical protein
MPSDDEEIISIRRPVKIKPRPIVSASRRALTASQSDTQTETAEQPVRQSNFCEEEDEDGFFTRKAFIRETKAEETSWWFMI